MPGKLASTINNWFPPKEKATATGVYITAATMFLRRYRRRWRCGIAVTNAGGGSFSLCDPGIVAAIAPVFTGCQNLQRADLFRKVNWKRLMPGVIHKTRAENMVNCRSFHFC